MKSRPAAETYLDAVLALWAERRTRSQCRLTGNSMAPLIRDGDLLVIEHGPPAVRIGDVIVFRQAGHLKAHRLLWRRRRPEGTLTFLAKGDASPAFDLPVPAERLIGRVIEIRGTRGTRRLTSPYWTLAAPAAAALSVLHGALARGWRARRGVARRIRALGIVMGGRNR
jgi:hypothetical protein